MILQVLRDATPLLGIDIDENTTYSKVLLGDVGIACSVSGVDVLALNIGDYIIYKSKNYTINKLPEIDADDLNINYSITFEPDIYTLYDKRFRHLGAKSFTFLGTLVAHAQLIIDNINTITTGWVLGEIDSTEELFITYDRDDCRTALTKMCSPENFNMEYDVDGKAINIKKTIGRNTGLTFEVGQGNGLYSLQRQSVDEGGVITRAYGYGGTQNIGSDYRGGLTELIFEGEFIDKNVNLYPNAKEGEYINTDIFPQRTGTITNATTNLTTKVFTVTDISLDFDIMTHLLENEPGKIVFKSGELSGSQFDILSHNTTTGVITFKEGKDIADNALPSAIYQAAPGDTYTLVDIKMPQSYIDAAESRLRTETQEYLDKQSLPQVIYNLDIDEKYIRDNGIELLAGDFIDIVDSRLNISGQLRISAISYPLVNEGNIKATISNFILDSTSNRVITAVKNSQTGIATGRTDTTLANRRQTANLNILQGMIFDPDGDFDPERIKPESIQTIHLAVGTRSQDFSLNVIIRPNYQGNPNAIQTTTGQLNHNTIDPNGVRTWDISNTYRDDLVSGTPYYIYASCDILANTGTIVLDTAQIRVTDIPNKYYFLIGVLSASIDGVRWPAFTYGSSEVNGRFITTGRIQSRDGLTYFDLDDNEIAGAIRFRTSGGVLKDINLVDQTANEAKGVTDNFTIIDGGLITSNTVKLGTGTNTTAGITGVDAAGDDSIMIWAGSTYENRNLAPFRVALDGRVWMTNAIVEGEIRANSGTIGGFNVSDGLNLVGTKVQVYPDKGVSSQGFLTIPTAASSDPLTNGKWQVYIDVAGSGGGGFAPPVVVNLTDLQDVSISGVANGQALTYNSSTGKWVNSNIVTDLSNYYTKSEINNFFSGSVSITGYNKSNWDVAYSERHTHSNKAFLDVINQNLSKTSSPEFIGATFYGSVFTETLHVETFLNVQGSAAIGAGMTVDNGLTVSTGTGGLFFKEYLSSSYDIELVMPPSVFGNNTVSLPSTSGQLALVSQIPTNVVQTTGSYTNPAWITSLAWSKISGTPTTLNGYGITDAYPLSGNPSSFLTAITAGALYEPIFSKNTAFNKNFGTSSGTVAEGNDNRINNGQTAYSWGNHASAGYALSNASNINVSAYKTALGLPTSGAYDLQWVTSNGYTTTTPLQAQRIISGYDSGVSGSVNTSDYLRVGGNGGVFWAAHGVGFENDNSSYPFLYSQSNAVGLRLGTNGGTLRGYIAANNNNEIGFLNNVGDWAFRVNNIGNTFSTNISLAANGFQTTAYQAGRNRIWSFANADNYGLSYHQGSGSIYGMDGVGIHFGNANSPLFNFLSDGNFNSQKITATVQQNIPVKSGGVATGSTFEIFVEL